MNFETRELVEPLELREADDGRPLISGYAAVFKPYPVTKNQNPLQKML